jgi:hypothetical protein
MRKSRIVIVSMVLGACVASCSSTSSTGGKDGGGPMDVTVTDVAPDVPIDEGVPPDGESDGPEKPDAAFCATEAKGACEGCCEKAFPVGHDQIIQYELTCACVGPKLCGALDSGVEIDAGKLNSGACATFCPGGGSKPPITNQCKDCLLDARGTMAKPGHCFTPVEDKCTSAPCKAYEACLAGCPTM